MNTNGNGNGNLNGDVNTNVNGEVNGNSNGNMNGNDFNTTVIDEENGDHTVITTGNMNDTDSNTSYEYIQTAKSGNTMDTTLHMKTTTLDGQISMLHKGTTYFYTVNNSDDQDKTIHKPKDSGNHHKKVGKESKLKHMRMLADILDKLSKETMREAHVWE